MSLHPSQIGTLYELDEDALDQDLRQMLLIRNAKRLCRLIESKADDPDAVRTLVRQAIETLEESEREEVRDHENNKRRKAATDAVIREFKRK